jgi:hypothetical protein
MNFLALAFKGGYQSVSAKNDGNRDHFYYLDLRIMYIMLN